jgi:hypothetical protein
MSDNDSDNDERRGYLWGDLVHVRGVDPEADRRWDEMIAKQESESEKFGLELEREKARELGVLDEFEKYASEGRYREFVPTLNRLQERQERKRERRIYFVIGMMAGALFWELLRRCL